MWRVTVVASAWEAVLGADAVVICTEWREFRAVDLVRLRETMATPIIFDGRNLYDLQTMRDLSMEYHSIGRADVTVGHTGDPPILA